jgi:hypothetical protein
MLTHKSLSCSKNKMFFCALLLVAGMACSVEGYAQTAVATVPKVKAFGIADIGPAKHVTYAHMLSYPVIECAEENCQVTGFTISFLPEGKDFRGPFAIKGSNKVQGVPFDYLNELNGSDILRTRIFIESIHVRRNGKDEMARSIVFESYRH